MNKQRGMVTFELAVGILSAVLVTVALVWAGSFLVLQARCHDTAVAVARQLGRGDADEGRKAFDAGPQPATMTIETTDDMVCVSVTASRSLARFPEVSVMAQACANSQGQL